MLSRMTMLVLPSIEVVSIQSICRPAVERMTHTGTALDKVSDTFPRNNIRIWVTARQSSDEQKTYGPSQRLKYISEECLQFFNPRRHPLEGPSRPCASQLRTGPAAQPPPAGLASARVAQIATRGSKSRPAALATSNKLGGGPLAGLHRDKGTTHQVVVEAVYT